jgi:acyl-coenzyme A synthetase/AMP-(fatty) acid ligase
VETKEQLTDHPAAFLSTIAMTQFAPSWGRCFEDLAVRFGERTAVVDDERSLTYRELATQAARLSTLLRGVGAGPGAVVATLLDNRADAVWASAAVVATGAAEAPVSPALSAPERRHAFEVSGARWVVCRKADTGGLLPGQMPLFTDDMPGCALTGHPLFPSPLIPADAIGKITFTSGTTGLPKAVAQTHGARWAGHHMLRAEIPVPIGPADRMLLFTPFPHGASLLTYLFLSQGASVRLCRGVDASTVEQELIEGRASHVFAPPTVLARLVDLLRGRRIATVKTIWTGTATLGRSLYLKARDTFGPCVRVTYGMSEVNNPICVLQPPETERFFAAQDGDGAACLGWPASGVEVEVRDEQGRRAPAGVYGEIHVRAPQMFSGYLGPEGLLSRAADGFHATGDIGSFDSEGRLLLSGRLRNVIKSGGYKLYPEEVELLLQAHIGDHAILGVPSDYWGEVVVGVLPAGREPDTGLVQRAMQASASLTTYKRPRDWLIVPELPRNAIGKLDRAALRNQLLATHSLQDGRHPRLVRVVEENEG